MNYGCSECLSSAIESHRPELLKALLERPKVSYRDMFGSRLPMFRWPNHYVYTYGHNDSYEEFPNLHEISNETDFSYVSRPDCVELLNSLTDNEFTPERILVSLLMLAQWHSSKNFNLIKILHDSGKFDFSEPRFYHILEVGSLD